MTARVIRCGCVFCGRDHDRDLSSEGSAGGDLVTRCPWCRRMNIAVVPGPRPVLRSEAIRKGAPGGHWWLMLLLGSVLIVVVMMVLLALFAR